MTADAPPPAAGRVATPWPGLLLAAALGTAAFFAAEIPWVKQTLRVSPLLLVIVLGAAWRAFLPVPDAMLPGVRIAQRGVLRWAVAGLGFRVSLSEIAELGVAPLVVVLVGTTVALFAGLWIARRLRVPESLGILLGVGGAICGASAVVAADTVVQGERRDAPVAIGIVTILGTVGMLLYPLAQAATGISALVYGVWDGASLHETAHVVAAGFAVSAEAARVATVVKLARIALLAPVIVWLGWSLRARRPAPAAGERPHVAPVPWFLVAFLVFAAIHSTRVLPTDVVDVLRRVDLWLLCVGMAGVGLQTSLADLRDAGLRPLAAATLQWLLLSATTLGLAAWLCR